MSKLLSLAHASEVLNLSVERVRQLVVAGDLPGEKLGNAWVVPTEAVLARQHFPRQGGRPLDARRAWQEISAAEVDLDRPGRYRRRADIVRCQMSRGDVEEIARHEEAKIGGAEAASEHGVDPGLPDLSDIYIARRVFDELHSMVAYVHDPTGGVRLRVVDDDAWEAIPAGEYVPGGAAALDLLDSGNPRHWIAARELVGGE
jgi:hypothetical protein